MLVASHSVAILSVPQKKTQTSSVAGHSRTYQGKDRCGLKPNVAHEGRGYFSHQSFKGGLADEQFGGILVLAYFLECHRAWTVPSGHFEPRTSDTDTTSNTVTAAAERWCNGFCGHGLEGHVPLGRGLATRDFVRRAFGAGHFLGWAVGVSCSAKHAFPTKKTSRKDRQ